MARIPSTILSGYLGSGKTTTINSLLRQPQGKRIAVLVNDFGAVNIDADLIETKDDQTISLKNGCVCCSIADDLGSALTQQTKRENPPDHLIIEASGVSQPDRIAVHVGGWPGVELCKIVTLIDPLTIRTRIDDKYVGSLVRKQIEAADLLLVSKIDLISQEDLKHVRTWLASITKKADIETSINGLVDPTLFLTNSITTRELKSPPDHELNLQSTIWHPSGDVDVTILVSILSELPACIHRAKGFVLDKKRKQIVLIQKTGEQITQNLQKTKMKTQLVIFSADPNYNPENVIPFLEQAVI